jgi:hypothetical protein
MPVEHAQQGGRVQNAVGPEVQLGCGGPLQPRGHPIGQRAETAGELAASISKWDWISGVRVI